MTFTEEVDTPASQQQEAIITAKLDMAQSSDQNSSFVLQDLAQMTRDYLRNEVIKEESKFQRFINDISKIFGYCFL